MIRPPGFAGAAFGVADDGDPRTDDAVRDRIGGLLDLPDRLAWARQVHGRTVLTVEEPGAAGDADGLLTEHPDLALIVATADCVPVVIEGEHTAAIVHAGWRGMVKDVVAAGVAEMVRSGDTPVRAAIGPSIGPCCYEVGPEVVEALGPFASTTTWGTNSVDLWSAAEAQLGGLEVWRADLCTFTDDRFLSYRRDGTKQRQVSLSWQTTG